MCNSAVAELSPPVVPLTSTEDKLNQALVDLQDPLVKIKEAAGAIYSLSICCACQSSFGYSAFAFADVSKNKFNLIEFAIDIVFMLLSQPSFSTSTICECSVCLQMPLRESQRILQQSLHC